MSENRAELRSYGNRLVIEGREYRMSLNGFDAFSAAQAAVLNSVGIVTAANATAVASASSAQASATLASAKADQISSFAMNLAVPYSDLASQIARLQQLVAGTALPAGGDYTASYTVYKDTTASMAAIASPFNNQVVMVASLTNGGPYVWKQGDYTARNLADPNNYVKHSTLPASNGVFVRIHGARGDSITPIGLFINATSQTIHSSVRMIETSGYRDYGSGSGLYVRDDVKVTAAYVTANPTWTFRAIDENGAASGWRLIPGRDGYVNIDMFGAYGNGTYNHATGAYSGTDDWPAWLACDTFLGETRLPAPHSQLSNLTPVRFSRKNYVLSGIMNLKKGCYRLEGAGNSYQNGGGGTALIFTGGAGMIMNHITTTGSTNTTTDLMGTQGMSVRSMTLVSFGSHPNQIDRHGIWQRSGSTKVYDVCCLCFEDDGIRVGGGNAGDAGGNEGIADNSYYENITCSFNNGNGLYCVGGDSNANTFINFIGNSNGLFGLNDSSFLANTFIGGQLDGSGHGRGGRLWEPAGPSSYCHYNGKRYGVVYGQHVAASTTVPGTDPNVWYFYTNAGEYADYVPTWTSGMTWKSGGVALFNNPNSPSPVTGMYVEGGLGLIQSPVGRALFFGGLGSQSVLNNRGAVYGRSGRLMSGGGFQAQGVSDDTYGQIDISVGGEQPSNGVVFRLVHTQIAPQGFNYFFNYNSKMMELKYGGGDPDIMSFAGPLSTRTYGRSAPVTNPAVQITRLFLGQVNNARQVGTADAVPTSGTYARGDVLYNINPAAGGFVGWVCVAGGTPGTWKTFGPITA